MKTPSRFAQKFTAESATVELMKDLGEAISSNDPDICMLGGGNPAVIPEAATVFYEEAQALLQDESFTQSIGYYSSPQGNQRFITVLANFFRAHYGWDIGPENIALTNGSQNSFFYLFNLLAGDMADGSKKKILFPLSPEYVGYMDLGLSEDMFTSNKPTIEFLEGQQFKYRLNVDELVISDDIAAICVSRPTNPTGNVITDEELEILDKLAKQHNIPLIIDNAYGYPFPGAIYIDAQLTWHDNIILGMSLSKLGLPGLRTGIIIANENIINDISRLNGITCLSPNNIGAGLLTRLIEDKRILGLRDNHIRPFYQQKMANALKLAQSTFENLPVHIHKPEGAFFLWLWFKELPISSKALYKRLKAKKVYVIPGENFFVDVDPEWQHQYQCIRVSYALSDEQLERGLAIIAEEVKQLTSTEA